MPPPPFFFSGPPSMLSAVELVYDVMVKATSYNPFKRLIADKAQETDFFKVGYSGAFSLVWCYVSAIYI